jgi:hypothetical protein
MPFKTVSYTEGKVLEERRPADVIGNAVVVMLMAAEEIADTAGDPNLRVEDEREAAISLFKIQNIFRRQSGTLRFCDAGRRTNGLVN